MFRPRNITRCNARHRSIGAHLPESINESSWV